MKRPDVADIANIPNLVSNCSEGTQYLLTPKSYNWPVKHSMNFISPRIDWNWDTSGLQVDSYSACNWTIMLLVYCLA